jgi:hypothetical protein
MTKQNDNTETVDFRFVVTGRPDDIKVLTAKWMRSNKAEVIEFLSQAKKSEIVACDGASPDRIHWAKIESAAFFKYLAEAFGAQIASETGLSPSTTYPVVKEPVPSIPLSTAPPLQPKDPLEPNEDNDDFDDDDFPEFPRKPTISKSGSKSSELEELWSKL